MIDLAAWYLGVPLCWGRARGEALLTDGVGRDTAAPPFPWLLAAQRVAASMTPLCKQKGHLQQVPKGPQISPAKSGFLLCNPRSATSP